MDHGECREVVEGSVLTHDCPPCPHGLRRWGTVNLRGHEDIDRVQRRLKLHAMDSLSCEHPAHDEAVAAIERWWQASGE